MNPEMVEAWGNAATAWGFALVVWALGLIFLMALVGVSVYVVGFVVEEVKRFWRMRTA